MDILNLQELNHSELKSKKTGEVYSQSAVITDHFGFTNLFVHHEILLPGIRSSSPHYHTNSEELIFVLEGNPTARYGNDIVQLKPGDFVGFKPGVPEYHVLENRSEEIVVLLVMNSNHKIDQVKYEM